MMREDLYIWINYHFVFKRCNITFEDDTADDSGLKFCSPIGNLDFRFWVKQWVFLFYTFNCLVWRSKNDSIVLFSTFRVVCGSKLDIGSWYFGNKNSLQG